MKRIIIYITFMLLLALPSVASVIMPNGDVNGDGVVNITDINVVIDVILSDSQVNSAADVNGDGVVNISDINGVIEVILNPPPFTETFTVYGVSFQMVAVEGGTFTMGGIAFNYEYERHEVTLSSYSIGKTEVTQDLWTAIMGSNPSRFNSEYLAELYAVDPEYYGNSLYRPVENVSWNDCQEFIAKLNRLTGRKFRLPTEAEWEYAARGGNKSHGYDFAGSNKYTAVGWFFMNSHYGTSSSDGSISFGFYATHPVATLAPNELTLYDMSGNVCEWCEDWYALYNSEAQTNPQGPETGSKRVYRGGYYRAESPYDWYVFRRATADPMSRDTSIGFRLALEP